MSISLLYRGYFPLSFTNSDIICCFIADLASYRQARQFYNLLSSHLRLSVRADLVRLGGLAILLRNITPWLEALQVISSQ